MEPLIRSATREDLQRINEIYNSYIVNRHTSFDTEPWTQEERAEWFEKYEPPSRYDLVVVEIEEKVMGFASSSPFRSKTAYDSSVETTIVLDEAAIGRGLGRPLLTELLARVAAKGLHRAYALIALPNDLSVVLHTKLGYRNVGVLDEVGRKMGAFHSVRIMELAL
ncbi:MAG: GNAT family N-acetyltransferase [Acidimicrobiia bacterium]|nr:GNAT family N-acetyltransferase [Acidimicrobiia bacterium]